jgi:hypothetical protein
VPGEQGVVSLRVLDPFDTTRRSIRTGTERPLQRPARAPGVRGAFLGLRHTAGRAPGRAPPAAGA